MPSPLAFQATQVQVSGDQVSVELFDALSTQLANSIGRLVELEGKRASMQEQLKGGGGDRRELLRITSEISGEKAKIDQLKQRIAELRSEQNAELRAVLASPTPPTPPSPPGEFIGVAAPPFAEDRVFGMNKNEATFSFFLALPIVIALSVLVIRRKVRPAAPVALSDERLARLEQAVESVAIEVERIGESQRFQAKLMSERQPVERHS